MQKAWGGALQVEEGPCKGPEAGLWERGGGQCEQRQGVKGGCGIRGEATASSCRTLQSPHMLREAYAWPSHVLLFTSVGDVSSTDAAGGSQCGSWTSCTCSPGRRQRPGSHRSRAESEAGSPPPPMWARVAMGTCTQSVPLCEVRNYRRTRTPHSAVVPGRAHQCRHRIWVQTLKHAGRA